ncbi:MAG: DNA polymerase [Nanoarchaeota archaeon]
MDRREYLSLFSEAELNDCQVTEIDRTVNILDEEYLKVITRSIKRAKEVSLDIETTGVHKNAELVGVGLAWEEEKEIHSIYIPVGHITNIEQIPINIVRKVLQDIFNSCLVIAFNVNFEKKELKKYKLEIPNFHDVRYDAVAYDDAYWKLSLKEICDELLGVKWNNIKEICTKKVKERNNKGKLVTRKVLDVPGTSISILGDYCRKDVVYTLQLRNFLKKHVEYATPIINLERRVTPVVVDMETRGIRVDIPAIHKKLDEVNAGLENISAAIFASVGKVFDISSPKQLNKILYEDLGLPEQKNYKNKTEGGLTTDVTALHSLKDLHIVPNLLLQFRELDHLRSTYLESPLKQQVSGRLYTHFNQTVESGRFSSSNPNLQNIDNDESIRSLFIPSEGMCFIDADYSQIEGRVVAHLSQDPVLLEYYRQGGDIHTATSEKLGIERKLSKVINFAIIYGCNPWKLTQIMGKEGYDYSAKDAKELHSSFWSNYCGIKKWREREIEKAHRTKQTFTLYGRRRLFPNINEYGQEITTPWGKPGFQNEKIIQGIEREVISTQVQGSSADIMKFGMVDVDHAFKLRNNIAHLLLTVHDELLAECYPENAEEVKFIMKNRMEDCVSLSLPLVVEVKQGLNWSQVH